MKLTWAEHSHTLMLYECTKLTWAATQPHIKGIRVYKINMG